MKVYYSITYPHGACSYYRSIGPWSKLPGVDFIPLPAQMSWNTIYDATAVYIERPCTEQQMKIMQIAQRNNIPVIVDFDDDVINLPSDNRGYPYFSQPQVQQMVKWAIANADCVMVSTQHIKNVYSEFSQKGNIVVVNNAFNDFHYDLNYSAFSRNKIFNWRGSDIHIRDLMPSMPALKQVYAQRPDWQWNFIGADIYNIMMSQHFPKYGWQNEMDIADYHLHVRQMAPSIQISPLVVDSFNLGKSNCNWFETTYAGSVLVARKIPEFDKPGIATYETEDQLRDLLLELSQDEEKRKKLFYDSVDYIKSNLMLSDLNMDRMLVLNRFDFTKKTYKLKQKLGMNT